MFFTFIRELLFDSKEELDYKSSKFNARKVAVFFIIVALALEAALTTYRLINQSIYLVKLKDSIIIREQYSRKQLAKYKRENEELKKYIDDLPEKVKKSNPVPSDSRNEVEKTTSNVDGEQLLVVPKEPQTTPNLTKEERKQFFKEYIQGDK
jgi:signal transduction histidine kinase